MRIAPTLPIHRMWAGRRLVKVQVIALTEPADPAHGVQTLLKGCEAAICPAEAPIIRAPRIVLGLGTISESDDTDANSQHEQQESHSRDLVLGLSNKRLSSCFIPTAQ
jgi:hypothetical protein